MSKPLDLLNKRFGRLIVIKRFDNNIYGKSRWLCKCDCEKITIVQGVHLCDGQTKSCGCLLREHAKIMGLKNIQHGHKRMGKKTKLYDVWGSLIQRCTNPNSKQWKDYGGRGITVCKRWLKFEYFNEDMRKDWRFGLQIERRNNDEGYCEENCYWATRREQNRNKRNNRLLDLNGKIQCVTVWSQEMNLSIQTILWRINNGWPTEKALLTPVAERRK